MPAPSPMTNPSRFRSNGRLAFSGASLRRDSAFCAQNPARLSGVIAASAPPVTMISASPRRMQLAASAMACAAEAQAVTVAEFGPRSP